MMAIKSSIFKIHRVLGAFLSILFLMWFVSGVVMMYHTYPKVDKTQALKYAEVIDTSVVSPLGLQAAVASIDSVSAITLDRRAGMEVFTLTSPKGKALINASDGNQKSRYDKDELQEMANRWSDHPACLLDSLYAVDVWLIGSYPFHDYPVYHYCLPGKDKAELYLSSQTGDALQYTTQESRFWAWVGAIPHWIYIKQFRAYGRQPWVDIVLWVSGICTIMAITGWIVGLYACSQARKRGKFTPYQKPWFRWHHLSGVLFGFFVITWIFSGYMSLKKVPQWLVKVYESRSVQEDIYGKVVPLEAYRLDYRKILAGEEVKRLSWLSLGGIPLYKVETDSQIYLVDASIPNKVEKATIDEAFCQKMMQNVRDKAHIRVEKMEDYDNYYISLNRTRPLPVYKITVEDSDNSCYYLDPKDGTCIYYNDNTRCRIWLYKGLHCFSCMFFSHHNALRHGIMWLLLIGGIVVSVTGLFLSFKYIKHRL